MTKGLFFLLLITAPLLAETPYRLMDNQALLAWYLSNPTDETKVVEKFGQNILTLRRIPATNSIQKKLELWVPAEKQFKVITINLQYFRDPVTGWETLQGMSCPAPKTKQTPEVAKCIKGHETGEKTMRLLLSARLQDPSIEIKVQRAADCIKEKVKLPMIELNCFLKAFEPANISKVKKELLEELAALGLAVEGGKIVQRAQK